MSRSSARATLSSDVARREHKGEPMSHYALQTLANDRYVDLRREADQSRLAQREGAVPASPPARIRRLAARVATLVLASRGMPLGTAQHPA
jgi:hypothetical protein